MPPEERGVGNPAALAISLSIRASTLVACGPRRPQAVWRTLNNGMPLVLVQDMALVPLRDGAGNIVDRLIHAATFGRGVFEVSLTGTPGVLLLLRGTVIDDGRPLKGAPPRSRSIHGCAAPPRRNRCRSSFSTAMICGWMPRCRSMSG
jgi:hypothetical protein